MRESYHIPGVEPEQIWTQIPADSSLIGHMTPATQAANTYYVRQIEAALTNIGRSQRLTAQDESDLKTRAMRVIVQPLARPAITDIRFEGNITISSKSLRNRILKLAVGNSFSERDFRSILDANIRPMFEERGFQTVTIRTASAGQGRVIVTTEIGEGPSSRRHRR